MRSMHSSDLSGCGRLCGTASATARVDPLLISEVLRDTKRAYNPAFGIVMSKCGTVFVKLHMIHTWESL